jgi:hypothetical protein
VNLARTAFRPRHRNSPRPAEKSAPAFLQWLRGRPCLLEGKGGCGGKIEAAHVDYAGDKGMGTKASDRFAVPMCGEHHAAQHRWGWQSFEGNFGMAPGDTLLAANAYWQAWPGRVRWEAERG